MSEQSIVCKNCGAPLDVRQGDSIAYCTYCNEVNKIRDAKESEEHFMLNATINRQQLRKALVGDLLKVPGISDSIEQSLQIQDAKLVYTPYYVTQVHGNLQWAGLGRQASYSFPYKGAYRNISFHVEPESGVFDDQLSVTLYAGKSQDQRIINYQIAPVGRGYMARGEISQQGGEIEEEEFDFQKATELAFQRLEAKHRALLNDELDTLQQATPSYTVGQNQLFHVPIWFVTWKQSGDSNTYTAIVDAAAGVTIYTDTPRSKSFFLVVVLSALLFLVLGAIPYLIFGASDSAGQQLAYSALLLGLVLMIQTFVKNRPQGFKESGT